MFWRAGSSAFGVLSHWLIAVRLSAISGLGRRSPIGSKTRQIRLAPPTTRMPLPSFTQLIELTSAAEKLPQAQTKRLLPSTPQPLRQTPSWPNRKNRFYDLRIPPRRIAARTGRLRLVPVCKKRFQTTQGHRLSFAVLYSSLGRHLLLPVTLDKEQNRNLHRPAFLHRPFTTLCRSRTEL